MRAYEPQAMPKANLELPHIAYSSSYEAAEGAEAILVLTEWDEFRSINWQNLAKEVARRLIIDGRNLFSSDEDASNGFQYIGIGGVGAAALLAAQSKKVAEPPLGLPTRPGTGVSSPDHQVVSAA